MDEEANSYRQPVKRKVRETVLRHAVETLTGQRESSPLVTIDKFDRLTEYWIRQFALAKKDLREPMAMINAQWKAVHASRVGQRAPSDLKVLFLCGPEPLNDLTERALLRGRRVAPGAARGDPAVQGEGRRGR